jgi:acyl-CoA reductase-like NAD-dependent aldehyde dehydrogenase
VRSPVDGAEIARVAEDMKQTLDAKIARAVAAFRA